MTWLTGLQGRGCMPIQQLLGQSADLTDVNSIFTATGKWVAGVGANYYNNNSTLTLPAGFQGNGPLLQWWNAGGWGLVSGLNWPNPSGGGASNLNVDAQAAITPGTAVYAAWHATLDAVAVGLLELKTGGMFPGFRPLHEMNGSWWWWGDPHFSDAQFVTFWRQTYDYLVNTKGCDHLIWIYSENAGGHRPGRYPGDAYVDIAGFDAYSDNPSGDGGFGLNQMADINKPKAFCEFGSGGPSGANGGFDEMTLVSALKNQMAKVIYVEQWSVTWAICKMQNIRAAMNDPWMLTREKLNRPTGLTPVPQPTPVPAPVPIPVPPTPVPTPLADAKAGVDHAASLVAQINALLVLIKANLAKLP